MNTHTQPAEHVRKLIQSFSTAMFITHGELGLHARPMAIAGLGDAMEVWFISAEDTAKVNEIEQDMSAHVVCQKDHSAYLSLSGSASLVHDRARVRKLWQEPFRAWFPGGPEDPNLVLICFRPERAEFWDNTGFHKLAYLWEAARAYATGTQPKVPGDSHGVVTLN